MGQKHKFPKECMDKVLQMLSEGAKQEDIAHVLGVNPGTVSRWWTAAGRKAPTPTVVEVTDSPGDILH